MLWSEEAGAKVKININKSTSVAETSNQSDTRSTESHIGIVRKRNNTGEVYGCRADGECGRGFYCYIPRHSPSHCSPCRRRWRRCHRDTMCCPGNYCSNYMCTPLSHSVLYARIPFLDNQISPSVRGVHRRNRIRPNVKPLKGEGGDACLRSTDCAPGHCCARHLWTRVCKPELGPGEACTKALQKKGSHRVELFQRCHCSSGLICRVQKEEDTPNAFTTGATHTAMGKATAAVRARLYTCQEE
ncbi:dickkopf-related protein 2-like [Chanos chanos]|uniref:Dickkopf-related protein 2-like n=1 Tax=Chanos chanos TaxID=29144 RepID=A0A6J2VG39_CHACN|nr:dickkopf-related protein 2-like [Chanos chanos]